MSIRRLLVLPHLKIHNANALSSPFTIGFPAMTAWLGFVHALQRKLNNDMYPSLKLIATGVVSHQCDLQIYRGPGDFVNSIIGTSNPLKKDGKRPSFIEEARCHLDVTLVIECHAYDEILEDLGREKVSEKFLEDISKLLAHMKVAGGDLQDFDSPSYRALNDNNEDETKKFMRSLMPGFVLIERRELMRREMEEGLDALEAMLEYLTVHHKCIKQDDGSDISWISQRKVGAGGSRPGWIVPIATGFHGISELSKAKNQRDPDVLHRFAESLVTLGEFKMAYRIEGLDQMLWRYHTDLEKNLYLCHQKPIEDQKILF